jgi:hypothetical protein
MSAAALPNWLPLLTDRGLGGGPGLYGLLLGALAAGQLAYAAGRWADAATPLGRMIGLAQALAGTALLLVLRSGSARRSGWGWRSSASSARH